MAKKQHVMSLLILSSLILGLSGCTETVAHKQEPSHESSVTETSTTTLKVDDTSKKLVINSFGVNVTLKVNKNNPKDFKVEGKQSVVQTYDDAEQLAVVLTQTAKNKNESVTITAGTESLKKLIIDLKNSELDVADDIISDDLKITAQKSKISTSKLIKAPQLSLKLEESNLEAGNIETKEAHFKAKQGSFKFEDVTSESLDIDLVRGSFVTKETVGRLNLSADQGDIKVGNITGSANLDINEASLVGNFKTLKDDLTIESEKGHIKLLLPEKLAFSFDGKGEVSTDFDEQLKIHDGKMTGKVNKNPEINIKVSAEGGSVDLSRPEKGENKHDTKNN